MPPLDWVAGKHVESIFLISHCWERAQSIVVGPHLAGGSGFYKNAG